MTGHRGAGNNSKPGDALEAPPDMRKSCTKGAVPTGNGSGLEMQSKKAAYSEELPF